jgi:putative addiction module killer protein
MNVVKTLKYCDKWFRKLDATIKFKIASRIEDIILKNIYGDCEPVGEGVFELKFHFGAGYRVYIGQESNYVIILLVGGDKKNQQKDINKAKELWIEYLKMKKEK